MTSYKLYSWLSTIHVIREVNFTAWLCFCRSVPLCMLLLQIFIKKLHCSLFSVMLITENGMDEDICTSLLRSYALENSLSFPMMIGEDANTTTKIQLTLFLVILCDIFVKFTWQTHWQNYESDVFKISYTFQAYTSRLYSHTIWGG